MSDWEAVGTKLRGAVRRPMARQAPQHERCDGCGLDVTRGTLRNVVKDGAEPKATTPGGHPIYRAEDWHSLCSRCLR